MKIKTRIRYKPNKGYYVQTNTGFGILWDDVGYWMVGWGGSVFILETYKTEDQAIAAAEKYHEEECARIKKKAHEKFLQKQAKRKDLRMEHDCRI